MKTSVKRRLALMLGFSLAASLSVATAAPAGAAELDCTTIISTTPGIDVDLNDDGNPEFRAPRIYDVTLCTEITAGYVTYPPTIENCSTAPKSVRCMALRFTILPAWASASVDGNLCFSIEGSGRTCVPLGSGSTIDHRPRTACIGYDLDGGHPCAGSVFTLE